MNPRTIIFAVLALTAAGVTALLVQGWMDRQRATIARPAPQIIKPTEQNVLVAKRALPAGRIVKPGDLAWQAWPSDGMAAGYRIKGKHKIKDYTGVVVRRGIEAHTPITDASVVRPGDRGFLAAVLTPGHRAVAVPVSAASVIAGLVFPGDRVDLILSYKYEVRIPGGKAGNNRQMRRASETVLGNIRVLALDKNTDDQTGKKGIPKTATLEVTPKQAEVVALATQLGRISLSLRSLALADGTADTARKPSRGKNSVTRDSDVSRLLRAGRSGGGGNRTVVNVMRGGKSEAREIQGTKR